MAPLRCAPVFASC